MERELEWSIDRINELTDVINSNEKKYFDGLRALVWLGVIVGIWLGFIMEPSVSILTLIIGCYILTNRTPAFLVEKRTNRGGGNIHNRMIAGILDIIAEAQQHIPSQPILTWTKNMMMTIPIIG